MWPSGRRSSQLRRVRQPRRHKPRVPMTDLRDFPARAIYSSQMRQRYACWLSLPVALVLLVIAWTMAVPLGVAQDEDAHYVKALGTGRGELVGLPPAQLFAPIFRHLSASALRHQLQQPRRHTPASALGF